MKDGMPQLIEFIGCGSPLTFVYSKNLPKSASQDKTIVLQKGFKKRKAFFRTCGPVQNLLHLDCTQAAPTLHPTAPNCTQLRNCLHLGGVVE
jgi:hypothetical protein